MPILIGMGAKTLAFFPTRKALVVEGITEMILLQLFLGSKCRASRFSNCSWVSKCKVKRFTKVRCSWYSVAYLVDCDPGGENLRKELGK